MYPVAPRLRPPAAPSITAIRVAALAPPATLEAFESLRASLTGRPCALDAIARACASEAGLRERFRDRIVPSLLRHAGALSLRDPPALLLAGQAGAVELPRALVASLVAHMVLGTMPRQEHPGQLLPNTDFDRLLARTEPQEVAKLRCMLAWFERIAGGASPGRLRIERDVLPRARTLEDWTRDGAPLSPLTVLPEGGIEDDAGSLQVDFANRFLGGGVLSGGCVQEEIRFAVSPELLAAMPLCAALEDHEAIRVYGAERHASVSGYGFGLAFAGDYVDPVARDADGTARVELVAIDATDLRRAPDPTVQLRPRGLVRELNKAWVGFGATRGVRSPPPIATGHWGCGAFLGHHQCKAVLQWIAASSVGAPLRYFTYGDLRAGDLAGFAEGARLRFGTAGALFARLVSVLGAGIPSGETWRGPWLFDALLAP